LRAVSPRDSSRISPSTCHADGMLVWTLPAECPACHEVILPTRRFQVKQLNPAVLEEEPIPCPACGVELPLIQMDDD